jgi:hypothetical protein
MARLPAGIIEDNPPVAPIGASLPGRTGSPGIMGTKAIRPTTSAVRLKASCGTTEPDQLIALICPAKIGLPAAMGCSTMTTLGPEALGPLIQRAAMKAVIAPKVSAMTTKIGRFTVNL